MGTSFKAKIAQFSPERQARIKSAADRLVAFDEGLKARMESLVAGVDIDIDAPLSPDDE